MTENVKRGRGRPPGSNTRLAAEAIEAAKATGKLPHEILLSMARGEPQTQYEVDQATGEIKAVVVSIDIEVRRDAAKAAAPYYAPKISTVEVIHGVQDDELDAIIAELAAKAGISLGDVGEGPEDEAEGAEEPRVGRVKLIQRN